MSLNQKLSKLRADGYITDDEYKILKQEPVYYPPCIDCNKKMDEIRNAYDNMITKTLEQESRWIPVSERFPEEDNCTGSGVQFSDDVLMSVLNIVDEEDFIDFGHTIDGEWYSIVEKKRIQNGFDVIAWMPLPQPYKGESEDAE